MIKIIIPKSTHYGHIIKDEKVLKIIEKSSDEDIRNIIDQMTRKYLRKKHPTKVIEGIEKIRGRGVIDVWYNYEQN